jgi:hypothetical protein
VKTLTKQHGILSATRASAGGGAPRLYSINQGASTGEWELLDANLGYFLSSGYFDLAGMTLQEKTLFFSGALVQDYLAPAIGSGVVGDNLVIVDLMMTTPFESNTKLFESYATGPGFLGSHENFEQITYGRSQVMTVNVDNLASGVPVLLHQNTFGSGMATASDRIYTYRIVRFAQVSDADRALTLPACRHILAAEAKEEPEFQYLMRLMRSYELQNEPDED